MKDNIDLVRRGILVLLPELDDRGRAIIYFDPLKRDDDTADNDKVFNIVGLFFFNFNCPFNDLMYSPPFLKSYV